MQSAKLKVAVFADDLGRRAMGTALVIQRLAGEYLEKFSDQVDLYLIHKEGLCKHPLCERAKTIPVKIMRLPKLAGFFSYLRFFIFDRERFDIIHFPRPSLHPFFWLLKVLSKTQKIVVTFHGAPEAGVPIFETFFTRLNRWFIILFGQFFIDAALADSDAAIEQIADYYRLPRRKIQRIYLGVDKIFTPAERSRPDYQYILTVARFDPHKNIHRLLEVFFELKEKEGIPHHLVIVGGRHEPRYSDLIEKMIAGSRWAKFVHITNYVAEKDLPRVYTGADVFVFTSLSEGFGLPLLEAMASGTPAITSSISCLPEIAGGAALLVDPYNTEAIGQAILKLLSNQKLRQELAEKGRKRAGEFSWRKMAEENIKLYFKLLG